MSLSNASLLSQFVNQTTRGTTIYQGFASLSVVAGADSIQLSISPVGTPISYDIFLNGVITSTSYTYIVVRFLSPNTTYTVRVKSKYTSGQTYMSVLSFVTLNEGPIVAINISEETGQYFQVVPSSRTVKINFPPSIGNPTGYQVALAANVFNAQPNQDIIASFAPNTSMNVMVTTLYGSRSYATSTSYTTLNENPVVFHVLKITGVSAAFFVPVTMASLTAYLNNQPQSSTTRVDLSLNTFYSFRIDAQYSTLNTYASETLSFTSPNEGPITNVQITAGRFSARLVAFKKSPGQCTYSAFLNGAPITFSSISGLQENTLYTFVVRSTYADNYYDYVTTFETLLEGPVDNISITDVRGTFLTLSWSPYPSSTPLSYQISNNQDTNVLHSQTNGLVLTENTLIPNKIYIFTISAVYKSNAYDAQSLPAQTLNEGPFPTIEIVDIYGDHATINIVSPINPYSSDVTYEFSIDSTKYSVLPKSFLMTGLTFDTTYSIVVYTTYSNARTYSQTTNFVTLNEYSLSVNATSTGTALTIFRSKANCDRITFTSQTHTETVSVATWTSLVLSPFSPNTDYILTTESFYPNSHSYTSDYLFRTKNEGPVKNLKLTVSNTTVSFSFDRYGSETITYVLTGVGENPKKGVCSSGFILTGLQIGTFYTLVISSNFMTNQYSVTETFTTLRESRVVGTIVRNSSGVITLDGTLEGLNYTGNVQYGTLSYPFSSFPIDISGSGSQTLSLNISYSNNLSTNAISYVSQSFVTYLIATFASSFVTVLYIENTFLPVSINVDPRGFYRSLPYNWPLCVSVFVSNMKLANSPKTESIDSYVILYYPIFNVQAQLSNLIRVIPYLFSGPNVFTFYTAVQNYPISFQFTLSHGSEIIYQTTKITRTSTNWTPITFNLEIPSSLTNVTVSVKRTAYEQSFLFIGSFSCSTSLPFTKIPSTFLTDFFSLPYASSSWNVLANNCTVSGWIYLHPFCAVSQKQIITVGNIASFPSMTIVGNTLLGHVLPNGVPLFFAVTSTNQEVTLYIDGVSVQVTYALTEPVETDRLVIGNASCQDYLLYNISIYDYVQTPLYVPFKLDNLSNLSNLSESKYDLVTVPLRWNSTKLNRYLQSSQPPQIKSCVSFWFLWNGDCTLISGSSGSNTLVNISGGKLYVGRNLTPIDLTNTWNHIAWSGGIFYWNGYIMVHGASTETVSIDPDTTTEAFYFDSLSASQVLSNYFQLFSIKTVEMSGNVLSVTVNGPKLREALDVNWKLFYGNDVSGNDVSGSFLNGNTQKITCAIDPLTLNTFRRNGNVSGHFVLSDFGTDMSFSIDGPYLTNSGNNSVDEGNQISINIANLSKPSAYIISGTFDGLSVGGNPVLTGHTGNIDTNGIIVAIKKDFKTNTQNKFFIVSIPELGIAEKIAINDTSQTFTLSSPTTATSGNSFTVRWNGSPQGTHYDISGVSAEDISFSELSGSVPLSQTLTLNVTTTATKQFTLLCSENQDISVKVIFNDRSPSLSVNKTPPQVHEGDSFVISVFAPYSTAPGTLLPYLVTGVHPYDISGGLSGTVLIKAVGSDNLYGITVPRMGGNVNFQVRNDHLTEGQQTFLFRLGGLSLPVYIIDTSITPTYNLYAFPKTVNTDESSFQIILMTTGIDDGTAMSYAITGVDETDISFGSFTGNLVINNGRGSQTFYASKYHQTVGNKTFLFTMSFQDPYNAFPLSLSTTVNIVETNFPARYYFISSLTSYYVSARTSFNVGLSGEYLLGGDTFVVYNITGAVNGADYTGVNATGTLDTLSMQKVTIQSTSPTTMVFTSPSNPNIVSFQIGLNYTAANPQISATVSKNLVLVTLFGYVQDCNYFYANTTGVIVADPHGFQYTTSFVYVPENQLIINDNRGITRFSGFF